MKSALAHQLDLAAVQGAVATRLQQWYAAKASQAEPIDATYQELINELNHFIQRGGMRLRPYLTYLAYVGYGGQQQEAILDVATSLELYHNYLLIHDDIIDRDVVRYGGPNITGVYRHKLRAHGEAEAQHFAEAMALLAGDMNSGLMMEGILKSGFSAPQKVAALERLTQSIFEVLGGELLDVLIPLEGVWQPDRERIQRVMEYKTASYSLTAPLQIGALLAEAAPAQVTALERIALPLGLAYQLTDDVIGVFGDEAETGKSNTGDLSEGKRTLLLWYGFELATREQRVILEAKVGRPLEQADFDEVKAILRSAGALAKIQELIATHIATARKELPQLGLNTGVQAALDTLITQVAEKSLMQ